MRRGKRTLYEVSYAGYDESWNTLEPACNLSPQDLRAFKGLHARRGRRPQTAVTARAAGAARARLSKADELRGGVPTVISMTCGSVNIIFKERRDASTMPTLHLTFRVLTMDRTEADSSFSRRTSTRSRAQGCASRRVLSSTG